MKVTNDALEIESVKFKLDYIALFIDAKADVQRRKQSFEYVHKSNKSHLNISTYSSYWVFHSDINRRLSVISLGRST